MSDIVRRVTFERHPDRKFVDFRTGDTLGVYIKVREGEKERVQLFKGIVLKIQGKGMGRSFTVRKMSSGIGVEKTFPFASPAIDRIDLIARGKVRRARLFYLRDRRGKAATIESELNVGGDQSGKKKKAAPEPKKEAKAAEAKPEAKAEAPAKKETENKSE